MRIDMSDVGTLDNEPRHNEPALTRANATGETTNMNANVKRLRDALSNLVVTDGHAEGCATLRGVMQPGDRPEPCSCGYIDRLAIARTALAASDGDDEPETIAVEAAANECEREANDWKKIAERARTKKAEPTAMQADERAHAALLCAKRVRAQMSRNPLSPNRLGSDADISTRWQHLLYAESRLQWQRDEIIATIGHTINTYDNDERVVLRDAVVGAVQAVLDDQVRRPSPDYRALLINTRKQLDAIATVIHPSLADETVRGAFKEALRLTDVEHLPSWPPQTLAGIALRHVVDNLIDELSVDDGELDDAVPLRAEQLTFDDAWITETLHDLTDARDKPSEYLMRKQAKVHDKQAEADAKALHDATPAIAEALRDELKAAYPIPGES